MAELVNKWKRAAASSKAKQTNRTVRLTLERDKRSTRAIRLVRQRAISRGEKTLESKGLGDIGNPEIFAHVQAKHPERQREIGRDIYELVASEELRISVEKDPP